MRLILSVLAVIVTSLSAGCGPNSPAVDVPASAIPSDSTAQPGATPAPPDEWAISADSAGPVPFGTPLTQLASSLPSPVDTSGASSGCRYVQVPAAGDTLLFMIEAARFVRVDVRQGEIATQEGARIGSTEDEVKALYPDHRVRPHKYTEGRYLIVLPNAPADTLHRLVFETDGRRVTNFRAGLFPHVEWVEGCS